jgi:hypothetical protein
MVRSDNYFAPKKEDLTSISLELPVKLMLVGLSEQRYLAKLDRETDCSDQRLERAGSRFATILPPSEEYANSIYRRGTHKHGFWKTNSKKLSQY